jgi:hypothetical protein
MTTSRKTPALRLLDVGNVPEFFAAELARIDAIGPCARLVFATPRQVDKEAYRDTTVTVIVPTEMLVLMARKLIRGPQPISDKGFEGLETRDEDRDEGTFH